MTARTVVSAPTSEADISRNAAVLERFSQAWGRADVDALMDLMTDDPTYRASTGPGPGAVYQGQEAVRAAFARLLGTPPSTDEVPPPLGDVAFFGNRALSFWALAGQAADGTPAVIEGVDVLTFTEDGRIAVKDAYRKAWPT